MERNKSINLRNIVIKGKVVKGRFLKAHPVSSGDYRASFELVLPQITKDRKIINHIVTVEEIIDKISLKTLLNQPSKKFDITIYENPSEGTINIEEIRIAKEEKTDNSELLKFINPNRIEEIMIIESAKYSYNHNLKENVNIMVAKGKLISAIPVARGMGYRASFDLVLPKITKDKRVTNSIVTVDALIDKTTLEDLLDTLRKQSSKILDITVSQNLSGTSVVIEDIEIPNALENDNSEILKFIKLDEILESTLENIAELENELSNNKVDMTQIIELLSVSREFGLLIGDIEENIKYTLESCKDLTRKIDNLLCDINRLQSSSKWYITFHSALLSFSSKLVSLKFNITLLMEKILLSQ